MLGIEEYCDEKVAALRLGVTSAVMRNWRNRGGGPPYVKYGRARNSPVRYSLRELRRFAARNTVAA